MKSKKQHIYPQHQGILNQLGENIRKARKRRKLTTIRLAELSNIDRTTLYYIEKGRASVSMGAYFNVLRALNLHQDLLKIAREDPDGRALQDSEL